MLPLCLGNELWHAVFARPREGTLGAAALGQKESLVACLK